MSADRQHHQTWPGRLPSHAQEQEPRRFESAGWGEMILRAAQIVYRKFKIPCLILASGTLGISLVVVLILLMTLANAYLCAPWLEPMLQRGNNVFSRCFNAWLALTPSNLDLQQCKARVSDEQASLLGFDLSHPRDKSQSWYQRAKTDQEVVCSTGFTGNSDVYGLGVRLSLYLQWLSSLVANNLFADLRETLVPANLFSAVTLVVALFRMAVQKGCNFTVEIEILYLLFMGCFLTLRIWPNLRQPGSSVEWQGLTWWFAISRLLYPMVLAHAAWFWIFGYATTFARMPCGTRHFILGPVKDKGAVNLYLRLYLGFSFGVAAALLTVTVVLTAILFARDIWKSLYDSAVVQGLHPHLVHSPSISDDDGNASRTASWYSRLISRTMTRLSGFWSLYHPVRPLGPRPRAVNQSIHIIISAFGFVYCVLAVEMNIHWNKISDVDSVDPLGQFFPLTIGLGTLIVFIYGLLKKVVVRPSEP